MKSRISTVQAEIKRLVALPQVIEAYKQLRENRVAKIQRAREVSECSDAIEQLQIDQETIARNAFLDGKRPLFKGEVAMVQDQIQLIQALEERKADLLTDPEVFDLHRLRTLQEYQKQLRSEHFAETPSRKKYIDQIRQMWAEGKKPLLTGATGTGKTELVLHAAQALFGVSANVITGHNNLTNYDVYGKPTMTLVDGKNTFTHQSGPLLRAIDEDTPLLIDEINVIPTNVIFRLKTDLNAHVGGKFTVQEDGATEHTMGRRFALAATANVKSEKHPDRVKLDPALVRMFESITINYLPPEELYDMMLASLMDMQGGINLSKKDAAETLPDLCNAAHWIQEAYLGQPVFIGEHGEQLEGMSTGKPATLREAVLDPGKAIGLLAGWESARLSGQTFHEFLNQKIVAFINNENFPADDRHYLVKIFTLKGFLKLTDATTLNVPGISQEILDAWSGDDRVRRVPKVTYLPPEIVAQLNPYDMLKKPQEADIDELLGDDEFDEEMVEDDSKTHPDGLPRNGFAKAPEKHAQVGKMTPAAQNALIEFDQRFSAKEYTANFKLDVIPNDLLSLLINHPSAYPKILQKMLTIILDTADYDFYTYGHRYTKSLKSMVEFIDNKPEITDIVKKILFKNKEMEDYWNTATFAGAIMISRRDIQTALKLPITPI